MTSRSLTREAKWLTVAGLLVSFHRLAVGFYLSDAGAKGFLAVCLVVLGGLAALVLTGAQMVLASALAKVTDLLLQIAWCVLLACAVVVMSASTLASMHGASLAEVTAWGWLRDHAPAVFLAVGLSLAIEIALASVRRASTLLASADATTDDLHLAPHEIAELEVQRELARLRKPAEQRVVEPLDSEVDTDSALDDDPSTVEKSCPWCDWSTTRPTAIQAANSLKAHQRFCAERPS